MLDPDTVDLFAGAGGLDLAAACLGRRTVGIEQWDAACETRDAAGLATVREDVRELGPGDFPTARHLMGGPPCQTFSVAGNGAGRDALALVLSIADRMSRREPVASILAGLSDERTGLVLEPLRWILEAIDAGRPFETVMLEQVPTVLPVWQAFGRILAREGYSVDTGVLKAEQYGVPQCRRRAFLVARLGGPVMLPRPVRSAFGGRPDGLPRWRSMHEALQERAEHFTVVSNYGTGGDPKNRGRRSCDEPAATVTGKISRFRLVDANGKDLNRFSDAEAGVLQTFPADHRWSGRDIGQQIGNACPPMLAQHVLAAVSAETIPAASAA